ncbi:sulfite oxidase heme-binding subunit YedZ [Parahalioglobus pacificus]|uniref:Protein-methionine-sulfoxide reductase heme-binding subunit MsrQ n=1 Tax=Parahalioglobus pacificus TaxID=930806 RepID=A0A919CN43_9GAMM|nr:protein-methionine-sulfoxide reductase heme-binding subunit MsrQ [Halioglobus pacificus]GHD37714.1 protein-methionine-sulfoxide reductase heme-binding subunit MsrQ [Halioglobus pacificus]
MLWLLLFLAALAPFLWLVFLAQGGGLGPDPARELMHFTGEWALYLLAFTLCLTPMRRLGLWSRALRYRRMMGMFAFFYGCLHLLGFAQLYVGWSGALIAEELLERPYILAGFLGWLFMLPLAITSTRGWQRRLGRKWVSLHKLVYPAAIAGVVHVFWQARSDIGEALLYVAIVTVLLAYRLVLRLRTESQRRAQTA